MNISQNKYDTIESFIFSEGLRITSLTVSPETDKLHIHLNNEHIFLITKKNYAGLKNASVKQ